MLRNRRTVDIALAIAAVLVLTVLIALRSSIEEQISVPSTYDTGPHGYAAVYDLLAREGVRVTRFEEPLSQLFARKETLVVAGDFAMLAFTTSKPEAAALDAWIRAGGTLAILGRVAPWRDTHFGVPPLSSVRSSVATAGCGLLLHGIAVAGDFTDGAAIRCTSSRAVLLMVRGKAVALAYRRGKGEVIFATTPAVLDNEHLAQRDNARFAYALFAGSRVAFDERVHGHVTGRTFWEVLPAPMRVAIIIACAAVLLAILGANLPFAPPHVEQSTGERDSSEYIASLARMLERGGAQRAIVQRFCAQSQSVLGSRAPADDRARELLERVRALQSLSGPHNEDVLAAARLFATVRKEYGC
jgi:hypothetical protein